MLTHSTGEVKVPSRTIGFAFRADPVALDGLKLTRTGRAVFALVLDNARSRGWRSRLSNSTMGRVLGCCPMTISRALGRLESAGLIRRDLIAGGRVRTGIVVTWDGVRREDLTGQASVRREDLRGSAQESKGVRREGLTDQSSSQSEDQSGGNSLEHVGEIPDPLSVVPDPATAAAYLRSLIAKGREAGARVLNNKKTESTPAPVVPGEFPRNPAAPVPPAGVANLRQPPPPSAPRQDDPRREVRVMVDQLAAKLATGRVGCRRTSPQQLAAQLAELRRRHGAKR